MIEPGPKASNNLELTPAEIEVLIDGLTDDVAFHWVLIHLGIWENPTEDDGPPTLGDVENAFRSLERLNGLGLIRIGRIQYIDGGPPGRVAPVEHIEEPLSLVKARVEAACAGAEEWADWAFSCWVVNTDDGDAVAR